MEMERALALSLLEGGYRPNYIDDTGDEGVYDAGGVEGPTGGGVGASVELTEENADRCWYFPG